jgi:hypothetical protein
MKLSRWSALPLAAVCWLSQAGSSEAAIENRSEATRCLALALYWEAKTEGRAGMLAVGSVVLNRVAHPEFPDTVCGVVKEGGEQPPCQFSWWCDGQSDRPTETRAWDLARHLAATILAHPPRRVPCSFTAPESRRPGSAGVSARCGSDGISFIDRRLRSRSKRVMNVASHSATSVW